MRTVAMIQAAAEKEVFENVVALCKEHRTQTQMAYLLGVSNSWVTRYIMQNRDKLREHGANGWGRAWGTK